MKLLINLFSTIVFFVAYYIPESLKQRVYVATAVASIMIIILVREKLTLLLQNKWFFMQKPTAAIGLFVLIFYQIESMRGISIIQRMMDHAISLLDNIRANLNHRWIGYSYLIRDRQSVC